jgi:hypothetical protein
MVAIPTLIVVALRFHAKHAKCSDDLNALRGYSAASNYLALGLVLLVYWFMTQERMEEPCGQRLG